MMFSDVVMSIDRSKFEDLLEKSKESKGVKLDTELDADDLKALVKQYHDLYKRKRERTSHRNPRFSFWKPSKQFSALGITPVLLYTAA